jgi:hypothetical protein
MPTAAPILCQDTTLTIEDGLGSPVTIGGVKSITGIGSGSAKEIDVTTLASTAKEFRQGLRDFGQVKIGLVRDQDDSGQLEAFSAMNLQAVREFVMTLPSSTNNVATFDGFVVSLTTDVNADDAVMGELTIRITGAVVWS